MKHLPTILCTIILMIAAYFAGKGMGLHQSQVPIEVFERARMQTEIHGAYAEVMHRVWIDNPTYVEDVLFETDEFMYLDSLVNGDHEDTFLFWSEQDSVQYEASAERERALAIAFLKAMGNREPDMIPAKAP